ncbi:hypothetical protein PhCBS80983_g03849 [Powellomyces hirtus]|uniref:Phospholipid scramblase n=1 Tax=Powellomyces hirtus TaxID=109895 RepID=A0A507E2M7_9FUNG|nr:hypothetical protein PhCBS80983_g03849 [Powellomyces hirtus]
MLSITTKVTASLLLCQSRKPLIVPPLWNLCAGNTGVRQYSARLSNDRSSRRPLPRKRPNSTSTPLEASSPAPATSLQTTVENVVPVHLSERDRKGAVLTKQSGAYEVLAHPALVVQRQIEMLNVFLGYEQGNKYSIKTGSGEDVGFIAEEVTSFAGTISRQLLRTRRPFKADILDKNGKVILKIDRPLKWFLNSSISIRDEHDIVIGEVKQVWHLWRRKYDLFWQQKQIGYIDTPFLAWNFEVADEDGKVIAAINRDFGGFAREIFTDTGSYAIHMDDVERAARSLSLDDRALLLACAVNIDIDYFSRHSSHGGGFMPIPFFGGGTAAEQDSNVPAPTGEGGVGPSSGPGGIGPGVFIPGMMGGSGQATDTSGSAPGSSSSYPASPPPPPPSEQGNAWGDSPFLSDEQAESGSSLGGFFDGFFDDD